MPYQNVIGKLQRGCILMTEGLSVTVADMGRPSEQRPFVPQHRPGDLAEQQEKGRQMLLKNGFRALGITVEEQDRIDEIGQSIAPGQASSL